MDVARIMGCCALAIACVGNDGQRAIVEAGFSWCDGQTKNEAIAGPPSVRPSYIPPLDSSLIYNRELTPRTVSLAGSHELLSLIMNVDGQKGFKPAVYPWPLFIQLTSNYGSGDAVGAYVREVATGPNWEAGYHVESSSDEGTKIGYNAEMANRGNARVIGINLQSKQEGKASEASASEAINIQTDLGASWETGIHFDGASVRTGIDFSLGSRGDRAIRVQGNYRVALDAGNGAIRMNAGTPLELDGSGQIAIAYDAQHSRILFRNGPQTIAFIDVAKEPATKPLN